MPKRTMLHRTREHQSWLIEKLANPRRAANYLNTALEDSPQMFLEAVRDVAQARQMTRVRQECGRNPREFIQSHISGWKSNFRDFCRRAGGDGFDL